MSQWLDFENEINTLQVCSIFSQYGTLYTKSYHLKGAIKEKDDLLVSVNYYNFSLGSCIIVLERERQWNQGTQGKKRLYYVHFLLTFHLAP